MVRRLRKTFTAAEIVALGATTVGRLSMGQTLAAGALPIAMFSRNLGDAAATLETLTVGVVQGSGISSLFISAQSVFAATAAGLAPVTSGTNTDDRFDFYSAWTPHVQFTGNANLSGLTGLANGVEVTLLYFAP